jgi:nucleotide-binding universal stress UspA family protein
MIDPNPHRILIPTDLSDFAGAALRWGGMLQQRSGARLTLLYASEPWIPFDVLEGPAAYLLQTSSEFRDRLAKELREHVQRHLPGVAGDVETRIVDKAPAQAVLDTADAIDADLIVMGTHGRTGWRRALMGSITEKVVHHTSRPLLCIPGVEGQSAQPRIGKILCPVNFTPVARMALEHAARVAETFDAELLVVHVADALDQAVDVASDFSAWIDPELRNRCRYTHVIATGNAAEEIIRIARGAAADLIVLGSAHKRFADETVIGTTTERVIRFAKRPVLSVAAGT